MIADFAPKTGSGGCREDIILARLLAVVSDATRRAATMPSLNVPVSKQSVRVFRRDRHRHGRGYAVSAGAATPWTQARAARRALRSRAARAREKLCLQGKTPRQPS